MSTEGWPPGTPPPPPPHPQPKLCGGKSLNDGVRARRGQRVTHYPHRLNTMPGAL